MKIVIATCVRPDLRVSVETAQWVLQTLRGFLEPGVRGDSLTWDCAPGTYIDAQRNWLVECHRDADALLFLDSDVAPPWHALASLLAMDVPVAVAPCPIWLDGERRWNVTGSETDEYLPFVSSAEPKAFRIRRGGTGCMLIRKEVFNELPWPWFKTVIRHATRADPHLLEMTDDEWFCDRCREAGFAIWAEPRAACRHPV